ncbi:YbaK/EbsC family protein [bacterium]|nr:YbaK/EbsC family protein [bacterium]
MPARRLKEYLDAEDVRYVTIVHSPAFTAQEVAALAHIPGKNIAKTVVVVVDERLALAVVPAPYTVDFDMLQGTIGASTVRLAEESEFSGTFPDCELGAMPPFGNLYGMEVYVARSLAEDEDIAFNACNHHELLKMPYREFERLVQPKVITFSVHAQA